MHVECGMVGDYECNYTFHLKNAVTVKNTTMVIMHKESIFLKLKIYSQ